MVNNLAELERAWSALGKIGTHRAWGEVLEPLIVFGLTRWEIYRAV